MGSISVDAVSAGNKHIVCQYEEKTASFGNFLTGRDPLSYSLPIFLLQISLISITSQAIEFCLRPLGQSSIVAHILGGVLFGPSLLGTQDLFSKIIFPARSIMNLEICASLGIMFFLFALGVRQDCTMMIRPGRQAAAIGLSAMFGTLASTMTLVAVLIKYVSMDETLKFALPFIALSQSLTAFANTACLLTELNMSSTNLGRIAIAATMLCDFIGLTLIAVTFGIIQSQHQPETAMKMILSAILLVLTMVFGVGPIIRKIARTVPPNRTLPGSYVHFCVIGTLLVGLTSEVIGQHFIGPLVFGLLVPDGQPLGDPIVAKLDYPVGRFLYPTFLTTSGLKTNFFTIHPKSLWIIAVIIFCSCTFKVASVVIISRFLGIKVHDSVIIGLVMNAKGISELVMFNILRNNRVLRDQEFALSVGSVVVVTAIITPLIKILYDPTKNSAPLKRRTIQHMKKNSELRILVCIKNQENVPTMINILEASNATEKSPILVIAVTLHDTEGQTTPMLVAHRPAQMLQPTNSRSDNIIKALHQYEKCHENCVTLQAFSAISQTNTANDDICRLALDQSATIIILPFHRSWEIDGSVRSENRSIQNLNLQVMNKAPCSVGILIDKGILISGTLSIMNNNQSNYRIGVLYIGGSDDAESLSYGARMGRHLNVNLTVTRFLFLGCDTSRERRQDNLMIEEVRQANMENQNFIYQEKVVKDGVGLAAALRDLGKQFNLLIVGKNHQESEILTSLGAWSECPELGVVGDLLAASDFDGTASVLVVQQQKIQGPKLKKRMRKPVVVSDAIDNDPLVNPN
ncbi:cation/H(+) antiporter 15-like [Andrographis paniculata]|uniref:cation/H(+) antiporter 15-like n=1 Tax=Andrographis paniculata TaxID=175694 RepID=UPI0021E7293A|nr:cation/H(+) antiporter 15-like [Andrographis paniculata]